MAELRERPECPVRGAKAWKSARLQSLCLVIPSRHKRPPHGAKLNNFGPEQDHPQWEVSGHGIAQVDKSDGRVPVKPHLVADSHHVRNDLDTGSWEAV